MSEAFLLGNNGIRFKRLTVPVPPDRTTYLYFNGTIYEDEDLTGAKIVADIGRSEVTLTPDNYSAEMSITSDTTAEWMIEATIGGTTRQVVIPLVLYAPDPVLNNNSWETIAKMSAEGFAESFWSIGDTKTEVIDGVTRTFRIIGFNHDELNATDSRYSDETYNQSHYSDGVRYAGITFQTAEAWGADKMNNTNDNTGGWDSCRMRNTTMPVVYNNLTEEMKEVIRTVNKYTSKGGNANTPDAVITSVDKVFLVAATEMAPRDYQSSSKEGEVCKVYEWYQNGNPFTKDSTDDEWTRSPHNPSACNYHNHFVAIGQNDRGETLLASEQHLYFPAFCV